MPGILTDEEALLAALDDDPANYTVLAALADLKREQGEDNIADWLEWGIRMKRCPLAKHSPTGWATNAANEGFSVIGNPQGSMVPFAFFSMNGDLVKWAYFLSAAASSPFTDPGWAIPKDEGEE